MKSYKEQQNNMEIHEEQQNNTESHEEQPNNGRSKNWLCALALISCLLTASCSPKEPIDIVIDNKTEYKDTQTEIKWWVEYAKQKWDSYNYLSSQYEGASVEKKADILRSQAWIRAELKEITKKIEKLSGKQDKRVRKVIENMPKAKPNSKIDTSLRDIYLDNTDVEKIIDAMG